SGISSRAARRRAGAVPERDGCPRPARSHRPHSGRSCHQAAGEVMRLALPLFPANHAALRGGFKTRMRSWLALAMPAGRIAAKGVRASAMMTPVEPRGVLLSFPIRGEALLVKLAAELRKRVADYGPQRDPFLLAIARCPDARLVIDRHAYIEFSM